MTGRQNAFLSMCSAVRAGCAARAAAWSAFVPFSTPYAEWEGMLEAATTLVGQQGSSTRGAAEAKQALRTELEGLVQRLTDALLLRAALTSDDNLALDAGTPMWRVKRMPGLVLAGHAVFLRGRAGALPAGVLEALGMEEGFLPALGAANDAFVKKLDTPAGTRAQRAEATRQLAETIAALRRLLLHGLDPAARMLGYTQPDFAAVYFFTRKIVDAPRRKRKKVVEAAPKEAEN